MFAVAVPHWPEKSTLGFPAVRQERGVPVLHPRKIYVFVDFRCESHYFFVVSKELARSQHPAEQQRRVDG